MSYLESINSPQDLKTLNVHQLNQLAGEIRQFLIQSVSETGGHLASNLGVVELTIALHKVFSTPQDKIIWDVGHQAYVHKILTGRREQFAALRKLNGLSGFPKCRESVHDCFDAGHASTSISAALGYAKGRDIQGEDYAVVAVIGDGALSGGLAYEGLNNAGRVKTNFIVVLNDNEMSISRNVGAMSKYLNKLRSSPEYVKAKADVEGFLHKVPVIGTPVADFVKKAKEGIKHAVVPSPMFEELGFTYIGPIDGHNIEDMTAVLERAKKIQGPVFLHVFTKKGKGYSFAEKEPSKFHGIGKFDIATGLPSSSGTTYTSASMAFGDRLLHLATEYKNIVAITAAMPEGTGLVNFSSKLPERFFDVGIAEGHAVTFAGGLAKTGLVPVVAIYSTFLQRAYDQLFHDVCLCGQHVVFALDRSGLVGEDGETHHGIYDLSYLNTLPGMSILAPSSAHQLCQMLDYAVHEHQGPIALRYPKMLPQNNYDGDFIYGKAAVLQDGKDFTLVAVGNMVENALLAAQLSGQSVEVIDLRTVKPFDQACILKSYQKTGKIAVLEDHIRSGGVGSQIESALDIPVIQLGYADEPILQGTIAQLHKQQGLDPVSIAAVIRKACGQ